MRLFFAILLPDHVCEQIARVQTQLKGRIGPQGIRWEDPGKFHITAQFLGEVLPERLGDVRSAGRAAAMGTAPFVMRLGRLGTFPKRGPARVLWLGAESDAPGHADLVRRLESELAALGFAGDGDSSARKGADGPSAHITLARVKHLEAGKSAVREISKNNSKMADIRAVFFVYNIVLVESELRPNGSVYSILDTFPLNTAGNQIDPSPPAAA